MNKAFSELVAANNAAPNTLTDAQLSAMLKMQAAVNNADALAEALEAYVKNHDTNAHEEGVDAGMLYPPDECDCDFCNSARAALAAYRGAK